MFFKLFLILFPLVFIPDINFSVSTAFGVLTPADFVLPVLYLLLLPNLMNRHQRDLLPRGLAFFYCAFILWAILGIIFIPVRYPAMFDQRFQMYFGLLKLGKFIEYGFFGYLLAISLNNPKRIKYFMISFAVGCVVLSISTLYSMLYGWSPGLSLVSKSQIMYKSANGVSVTLAILICFWAGMFVFKRWTSPMSLRLAFIGLLSAAMIVTLGRGGWIATVFGLGYLLILRKPNFRGLIIALAFILVFMITFTRFTPVKTIFLSTFKAKTYAIFKTSDFGLMYGIDDGSRIGIFVENVVKITNAPILGVGFFNRAYESGLEFSGSHNFFLQMALETGLVGLFLLAAVFWILWKFTSINGNFKDGTKYRSMACRAALIAIAVGSLSGEYLYGGLALLSFSIVIGITVAERKLRVCQQRDTNDVILTDTPNYVIGSVGCQQ